MRNPLFLALDVPDGVQALRLATSVQRWVGGFKIGKELFVSEGPNLVRQVVALGLPVFLDLKFHDIPNTVGGAVRAGVELGASMLTIHTTGGCAMMVAAERAGRAAAAARLVAPPVILGVTVLTSLDEGGLAEIGVGGALEDQVARLARLACDAGLGGLVCSALEARRLRETLPRRMILVTPGIRLPEDAPGDQKRVLGPLEAIAAGADWLVVGRPIYAAADPVSAARRFAEILGVG